MQGPSLTVTYWILSISVTNAVAGGEGLHPMIRALDPEQGDAGAVRPGDRIRRERRHPGQQLIEPEAVGDEPGEAGKAGLKIGGICLACSRPRGCSGLPP